MPHGRYCFSRESGAKNIAALVSDELFDRMQTMCNILEISRTALTRFLLTRGMDQLEAKMIERLDKVESGAIHVGED